VKFITRVEFVFRFAILPSSFPRQLAVGFSSQNKFLDFARAVQGGQHPDFVFLDK